MELIYYVRLARRNWFAIVLSLILAMGTSLVVTANTSPKYQAMTTMLVSGYDKQGSLATALQAGALSQQRVQSYANLMASRRVVGQIVPRREIAAVQSSIKSEAIPLTMLLRATVTDVDPRRAAQLANSLGTAFARVIDEIERPGHASQSTVRVTVVDRAEVPQRPVSPRPLVNMAVALLIGLLVGLIGLAVRDRLDTRIRTSESLHRLSKSPTLGIIEYESGARRDPLIVRQGGRSSRAESFRSLRTNLQFQGTDKRARSLVITSCLPEEGKTSVAVNLSITFAQAGWRVMLVEGDLRRPRIPKYLGIEGSVGLADVLTGQAKAPDVIQSWGKHDLFVLPGGQIPTNPSELLGSQSMRELIGRFTADYDIVIIDAPPLLPVTDAATLAAICDDVLLVARYGRTRQEQVLRAGELLSSINAHLVGTVLNFVSTKAGQTYGYAHRPGYEANVNPENTTLVGV
ncbi:polysaccharide biosynthesis tyrosine autokinase [Sphaerisporangium corydalis]|uniref:non-specific protein-tyrosine kinase n=1 Tax=Sphaerisporangium corydalis TaxID=1441875 RepID=A0ABV9EQH3_9ACTN|nr:polysaccharide biosynthesis tyrosine autokinase [Sphaerisporangium corydalis]